LLLVLAVVALYVVVEMNWSYSTGERAGWIQKFSRKGWLCKTWEGEMAMVTMPGTVPEKFAFTVRDEHLVAQINQTMGRRVALTYEQKKGPPDELLRRHRILGHRRARAVGRAAGAGRRSGSVARPRSVACPRSVARPRPRSGTCSGSRPAR